LLENIFDMFVQADDTLDRREGGMGVGLTLVRSLVEMHGGSVIAHSDGEGQGSEFMVQLPVSFRKSTADAKDGLRDSEVKAGDEPADAMTVIGQPPARRILLIEDNPDARQMLRTLLELDGHHVDVAEDGKAGLETLVQQRPEVALVDIGLPEIDGYELARRARRELDNGDVYLVALTGYGQQKDRAAVLAAGFDEHLVKPVNPDQLARVLSRPRKPK
jgi:CheY-like chemotaxis protein